MGGKFDLKDADEHKIGEVASRGTMGPSEDKFVFRDSSGRKIGTAERQSSPVDTAVGIGIFAVLYVLELKLLYTAFVRYPKLGLVLIVVGILLWWWFDSGRSH